VRCVQSQVPDHAQLASEAAALNWLAHVFLSGDNVEQRLGNLLADLVRGADRAAMSADFLLGVRRHQAIDSYTDAHPVVRRSRTRIGAEHRRFSGVLVDVFYDYFLATNWIRYSSQPLQDFTADFYADVRAHPLELPEPARMTLDRIIQYDLLSAYRSLEGVEQSLRRLSRRLTARWRREFALERAVADLRAHEAELAQDFATFFPELQAHVAAVEPPSASH
jgi:acyl carrier protein phosphodiesterase